MAALSVAVSCPPPYRRRRPERTLLYRTVQTHFATWLALQRDGCADGDPVPVHVEREFRRYLEKRFVNALLALIPLEGALLLLAHVAKPAASAPSTSEGYSGSTGWHNAVRARLYLRPEVQHDEAERPLRTGNLQLELQKSNLGPVTQTMTFSFDEDAHPSSAAWMSRAPRTQRFNAQAARDDQDARAASLMLKAMARGGNELRAREIARQMPWDSIGYDVDELFDAAQPLSVLRGLTTKASVAATTFPTESGPLRFLMGRVVAASVLSRLLDRVVRVPFLHSSGLQILGTAAAFVGEGESLSVARSEFASLAHHPYAAGSIMVATRESIDDTPQAETLMRDELIRSAGEAIDGRFVSADAATAIAPAGIAENATEVPSTGATVAAISTDFAAMVDVLASLVAPVWLMPAKAHAFLTLLGITNDAGDRIAGFPVYSSASIDRILLLASDRLALSLGDEVSVSVSDHGDIEMSDAPTGSSVAPTETQRVSLFQTGARALRMLAFMDWTIVADEDTAGSKGVIELTSASFA